MKLSLPPEKLKPILIMFGILIALALPLMFLLEDFVRDAIVIPVSYYAWYFGVILDALPHSLFVGILVIVLAYLAAMSLRRNRTAVWRPRFSERQSPGSVRIWTDRINLVSQGDYSRERFEHQFGQLVMHLIAHEERLSLRAAARQVQMQELDVPPELERYLLRAFSGGQRQRRGLWAWLRDLFSRRSSPEAALQRVAEDVEPALLYLERQLRIVQEEELDG
jgi:hypothetical protein